MRLNIHPRGKINGQLALIACMCLGLIACDPSQEAPKPTIPSDERDQAQDDAPIEPWAGLTKVNWDNLPEWPTTEHEKALSVFLTTCEALGQQPNWHKPCTTAQNTEPDEARMFFEDNFTPYAVNATGKSKLTGYYEPLLKGSRTPGKKFRYPIYSRPPDLLKADLESAYPAVREKDMRVRIKDSRFVVPYYSRSEIDQRHKDMHEHAIVWVDDIAELFFLHVQGSGRVMLESGEVIRIGFSDHNGWPYRSLGQHLFESGILKKGQLSGESIKEYIRKNEETAHSILSVNPRYIFFREMPHSDSGPIGSLGIPLVPLHSVAADPRHVPLGMPIYIETSGPTRQHTFNRLVIAQDTGAAIKGPLRLDYFWGFGEEAGKLAGTTNQSFKMWQLLPNTSNYAETLKNRTK